MKKIVCFVLLGGLSFGAHATDYDLLTPYVGFNAQVRDLGFKKGYGKENFASMLPQGEVVAGFKVNPYLGFELGYLRSIERHRNATVSSPSTLLGDPLPSGEYVVSNNSSRIDGAGASIVGFLPINEDIQLLGSVGIARLRVKLHHVPTGDNFNPVYTPAIFAEATRDFVACKYVPQVKVGVQYMLSQVVGLKGMIGWDGTKRFDLLINKQAKPARVSLKDSYNVGLGLAYYFN